MAALGENGGGSMLAMAVNSVVTALVAVAYVAASIWLNKRQLATWPAWRIGVSWRNSHPAYPYVA